jgi:hypothetical protein
VHPRLRAATTELSWLLGRGYRLPGALTLVGDHHQLRVRQRQAVSRAACSDLQRERRARGRQDLAALEGAALAIDGFNCLITLEVMLAHGPVLLGRDGTMRDLASVHGTYRRVDESLPALALLASALAAWGVGRVHVWLDKPVSNSARVRQMFLAAMAQRGLPAEGTLCERVDRELVRSEMLVASSDGWVLDHAARWIDLPSLLAERERLPLWRVDLREPAPPD